MSAEQDRLPDLSTITYKVADTKALAENREEILSHWAELYKKVS